MKKIFFIFLFVASSLTAKTQLIVSEHTIKFGHVLSLLNSLYVDTVSEYKLTEIAIVEMLKKLDPHSVYIPKEEVREMNEPLEGGFEGIGVMFNLLNDTIFVVNPIPGGPSERVGIRAGDRIVIIEGVNVGGVSLTTKDVRSKLLGKKGTKVNVGIRRRGESEQLDFTITRDKIPIYSVDASYMINDSIGYIKLNNFGAKSMIEINIALDSLLRQNMKHLIFDLSGNGGGYLEIAAQIADQFLQGHKMITYTQGRTVGRQDYFAENRGSFESGRIAMLIDEGSASASEILSGAIQDWDRGIVVGRRSFGKGLVQRQYPFPDSSMIRLTIAKYYTPSGRCIQKSYENGYEAYTHDIVNRYNSGELTDADKIHFPDSLRFKTLVNGRTVYGGGGIMPDYFIPLDTSINTQFYRKLIARGVMNDFILNYIDSKRKMFNTLYPNFVSFKKNFEINDEMMADLLKFAANKKIVPEGDDMKRSETEIRMIMKAYIARDIWHSNEFFQIYNEHNEVLKKAIEVISDLKTYQEKLMK